MIQSNALAARFAEPAHTMLIDDSDMRVIGEQARQEAAAKMHLYPNGGEFYLRHALAKQLGVPYLARSGNEGAKAGNVNNALAHSNQTFAWCKLICTNTDSGSAYMKSSVSIRPAAEHLKCF